MAKKSDQPEPSPQLKELEQKVDALMSTELPAKKAAPETPVPKSSLKVVSDYAGNTPPQTAPELSPKLKKSVKTDKTPTPKTTAKATAVPPALDETEPTDDVPPTSEPTTEQPEAEPEAPIPPPEVPDKSIIDDPETDRAVSDIVVREGDMQLAVDDAITRRKAAAVPEPRSTISGYWIFLFFIVIVGTAAVLYLWFR